MQPKNQNPDDIDNPSVEPVISANANNAITGKEAPNNEQFGPQIPVDVSAIYPTPGLGRASAPILVNDNHSKNEAISPGAPNYVAPQEATNGNKRRKFPMTLITLSPIIVLAIFYFVVPMVISSLVQGPSGFMAGIGIIFLISYLLQYGIRVILFFFSMKYVRNETNKNLKTILLFFLIFWTVFFPNTMTLSDKIKLPAQFPSNPLIIYSLYLIIVSLPYIVLTVIGQTRIKRKTGRWFVTSDLTLALSLVVYIGVSLFVFSNVNTLGFTNDLAVTKNNSAYQKIAPLVKKDHTVIGALTKEEILKSIIGYNESRDPNSVSKYFMSEGLLAGYYYRTWKYNETSTDSPKTIEKDVLDYPNKRLEDIFGPVGKSAAQEASYYQGSDFYSRNSRYYAYSIYQTQKINLSDYIGMSTCPGGSMQRNGYYNSNRYEKDSSGKYVQTDKQIFKDNVGLDPTKNGTEFYASSLDAFYPGPQKQTGLVTTFAIIILMKNTQTNKWYLFDIADSSLKLGDQCEFSVTTNDYGTLKNTSDLEYIGKYYDLKPQN